MTAPYIFEKITHQLDCGTRPHWDSNYDCLYFTDVPNSLFYKYKPSTNKLTKVKVGNDPLAFSFPTTNGKDNIFIAGSGKKFVTFSWDGTSNCIENLNVIGEVDTEKGLENNRLNGAKIDPYGRLWAGTMNTTTIPGGVVIRDGSLYCVTKGKIKKQETNIGISNGLEWDTINHIMYYVDSTTTEIFQYDYDPRTGDISNRTVCFNTKDHGLEGLPDGMAQDVEGNIWIALIHGGKVVKFDPKTGNLLQQVRFPTPQITSMVFGDKSLDTLYVTTARLSVDGVQPQYPAGCTYRINSFGTKGLKQTPYKL